MAVEDQKIKKLGRIILRRSIPELTGFSVVNVYRLINAGLFPKPVRLGANRVGWLESEIEKWLQAKVDERDST